jgi:hypothetical protein
LYFQLLGSYVPNSTTVSKWFSLTIELWAREEANTGVVGGTDRKTWGAIWSILK